MLIVDIIIIMFLKISKMSDNPPVSQIFTVTAVPWCTWDYYIWPGLVPVSDRDQYQCHGSSADGIIISDQGPDGHLDTSGVQFIAQSPVPIPLYPLYFYTPVPPIPLYPSILYPYTLYHIPLYPVTCAQLTFSTRLFRPSSGWIKEFVRQHKLLVILNKNV